LLLEPVISIVRAAGIAAQITSVRALHDPTEGGDRCGRPRTGRPGEVRGTPGS
jgi:hypothetical protein